MADPSACIATSLGPLYNACCAPVYAAIGETVASYLHRKQNRRDLTDALRRLQAKAEKLKEDIEREAQQLGVCNSDVEDWQKRAEEFMLLANRVVDDDSGGCTYRCRVAPKVSRLLVEVDCLLGESFPAPLTHSPPPEVAEQPTSLEPAFGMDSILQKLWSQFNLEENSIVGVYGLGGVGKTTLLKTFNNELRKSPGDYQAVIMIEVANSVTLNVATMQRTISDRLGLLWKQNQSEKDRAAFLLKVLRKKKKFVMLLDDVWQKFELEDVGIPIPNSSNGCKLVVASRLENVCAQMGAMNPIAMQCLEKKEAWDLFLSKLTDPVKAAINEHKGMYQSADEIVNSCGGLPLALNVVGSALTCSREPNEWRHEARAITQNISRIDGADKMVTVLKYSYDMLGDRDRQKECFLYCTLFPDYGSINKELLVHYWVAEGLISAADPDEGHKVIRKLVSACLLQSSDTDPNSEVTMHQMIRRMGHQQASEFFVQAGKALKQAPNVQDWKNFTRISLMSNDIRDLSISPDCRRLLTLLLQNNPNLRLLGPKFFKSMSSLKVLDLSHTAIENLPECSALSQLVYLNLSHTLVKEFPNKVCNALVELLYLNMSDTRIQELPRHLWKLQKLTHLHMAETSALRIIPHGTISKLYRLKVLNLYRSNYGIIDADDLNLEKLEELKFLGITIYSQEVFAKLKRADPLARSTRCLSLSRCPRITTIQLSEFKKMGHLKELHIESCIALEKLIVDHVEKEDSVKRVKILTLASLPNLVEVSFGTATHRFQDLRDLTIRSCPKLKHVSWVMRLQSLERLVISDCDELEELVLEEANAAATTTASPLVHSINDEPIVEGRDELPRLRIMELKGLQSLRSICQKGSCFPGLESIRVEGCQNLKDLPATGVPKLKQICGEVGWWEGLTPEMRTSSLADCFVPI